MAKPILQYYLVPDVRLLSRTASSQAENKSLEHGKDNITIQAGGPFAKSELGSNCCNDIFAKWKQLHNRVGAPKVSECTF